MRIVFYNTNSNHFDPKIVHIKTMPSWAEEWDKVTSKFPEHEFFIASMLPGMFLVDYGGRDDSVHQSEQAENVVPQSERAVLEEKDSLASGQAIWGEAVVKCAKNVKYLELRGGSAEEIANEILTLNPDVALAASFWITPYDWLSLQDAMIAEILREHKVKTISHKVQTEAICFDKYKTHIFLEQNNFNCAKAVHVNYDLFWSNRKKPEVKNNVYREYILREISKLQFPVIIKDTTGLSSYGMEVMPTVNSVQAYLDSKKFNSDRLVEEFLDGIQFGTEIHTVKKSSDTYYPTVFPPLMYSVNQYGITSPKQSVKLGPLDLPKFKTAELTRELERLAKLLEFEGSAQIDLVFHKNEWYIIEINPRLSGSSGAIALIKQKSLPLILTELALGIYDAGQADENAKIKGKPPLYLNIKFPNLTTEQMKNLYDLPFVKYLCQTDNDAAKQRREMGFCEILFGGVSEPAELLAQLEEIKTKFPEVIEISFYETAKKMIAEI